MRELLNKTIDGQQYEFSQFGAKQSLRLLMKISKIVGKPMSLMLASAEGKGSLLNRNLNPELLSQAVEALVSRLDENEVMDIVTTLTSESCLCGGKKIDFNSHYQGRLDHMFKVLFAALEVQYGNFFDAISALPGSQQTNTTPVPAT